MNRAQNKNSCRQAFIFEKTDAVNYLLTFLVLFLLVTRSGAQSAYWQQQVDYKINVQLNDEEHTLDGFARIRYTNHSPDTLTFIWFHLWPNAYRTDRTAFSDQLLENGRTDFYFSNRGDRGYINRLDFRVNEQLAETEDHPQHIDIIKLILPRPLAPGNSIEITTPFHVQLPANFSRGGHVGQSYQVTQWYPKPAVYDRYGWHPMPYLDQGEYYSEFGDYEVMVTLPQPYVVLSTGRLESPEERAWLHNRKTPPAPVKKIAPAGTQKPGRSTTPTAAGPREPIPVKTLVFKQERVHDFAWFADKNFIVQHDTVQLGNGHIVEVYAAHLPGSAPVWKNSVPVMKEVLRSRSNWVGTYPYSICTAVEAKMGFNGGMEYPCITSISPVMSEAALESVLEHEVGHNWFQGILASNERLHAWMDEGINSYYGQRFSRERSRFPTRKTRLLPTEEVLLYTRQQLRKDAPLSLSADSSSETDYVLTSYVKGAMFMQLLENHLGRDRFDKGMQLYYETWKFRHPNPADLQQTLEQATGQRLDSLFALVNKTGPLQPVEKKTLRPSLFTGYNTPGERALILAPFAGSNLYDGLMPGLAITNYTLAPTRFHFLVAPLYGTRSREWNGAVRLGYNAFPDQGRFERIHASLSGMKFSTNDFTDTAGRQYITGFRKLVPSVRLVVRETNPRSTRERFIQWKTFLFWEDRLRFRRDTFPNGNRFTEITRQVNQRYLNQLRFVVRDTRALYPYQAEFQAEQAKDFVRLAFTGNYYFNYNERQGANVRFFAGKFIYLGERTLTKRFLNDPYHLNMSGPKGYEDYTYSNYFAGRNEFEGFASQQIMMRDGGFKVRTDLLAAKVGKTDNWLAAMNFVSDLPDAINILNVLPVRIPLKVFLDLGTYAEVWGPKATGSKILYDAGLQLSLLSNTVQVYFPLFYSNVYRDYFQSTFPDNRFRRNIAFSIDIQQWSLKKLDRRLPF